MTSETREVYPIKQNKETHSINQQQQTFDIFCEMRSIIGNKLACLY